MGGDGSVAESRRGCCLLPTCSLPALYGRGTKSIAVPVVPDAAVVVVVEKPLRVY